jgi:DNA-binding CsgD family transcriptional regulator
MRTVAIPTWLASWSETGPSNDPRDELLERAEETTRLLRELVPCAAYALCAWDPVSGSHVHRELASHGYAPSVMAHINDGYVKENPAFRLLHTTVPRALRWRDLARDWELDFSSTYIAEEFLIPEGIHEGTTACLRLRDGRYTGSLHMSWSAAGGATDERLETIERFRPVLAMVCDLLRAPQILVEILTPGARAIVVSADGTAADLSGPLTGSELAEGAPLRNFLTKAGGKPCQRRFLWLDRAGACHKVSVIPCRGEASLVTEESIPWPYGLTARELDILHLVARGYSNPQIAHSLIVSPRTVSTHVEHLLAKIGCSSRAQLAAIAVSEGLLLAEDPRVEPTAPRA